MSNTTKRYSIRALFHGFPANTANSFWKFNSILHIIAIAITYLIVTTGMDWKYYRSSMDHIYLQPIFFPAVLLGGLFPIAVPVFAYFYGKKKNNERTINTSYAIAQAAIIGLIVSSLYKAFTGRIPPEMFNDMPSSTIKNGFQFGFMRGGIFNGWPSGHTTTAFAMSVCLIILYPENRRIRYLALAYALYIGLGISTNIHWFSDFVAGTFVGIAIGLTVGKNFRKRYSSGIR